MTTALKQLKTRISLEVQKGRQITWMAAFATSRPARKHIYYWFEKCPPGLSKAVAIEWLAEQALLEREEQT